MVNAMGSNSSPLAVFLPAKALPYIEMRPRCCAFIAESPDDFGAGRDGTGVGGGTGAGDGGAGSGARSICAQPNSIAQASAR
jgi:hypothetical protein